MPRKNKPKGGRMPPSGERIPVAGNCGRDFFMKKKRFVHKFL
jgi:hypothetical protein